MKTSDWASILDLVGHSITYRIAVGPHRGRKVFTLHSLPTFDEEDCASQLIFSFRWQALKLCAELLGDFLAC